MYKVHLLIMLARGSGSIYREKKLFIGDLIDEDLKSLTRNILSLQREDTQTGRCFHGEVSARLPVEQAPHWGPNGRGS